MTVLIHRRITQTTKIPDLAQRIHQAQVASNLSVSEVCRRIGISRTYWYKLINDKVPEGLTESTLRKIENVLDADFKVVFEETIAS